MTQASAPVGDIGRRLALRRQELGLTREQVAERAGIAPGYLQYVEEQPFASPGPTCLLRVAQALETSVPRLRGADAGLPPGLGEAADHPSLIPLGLRECLTLLSDHGVGRVAVTTDDGPAIVPVNYVVTDGAVVFRTAPSAAPSLAADHEVAFEVDRIDEALSEGWSVLVLGPAAAVTEADERRDLADRARTGPWAGGDRPVWIRIEPRRVTGRRITAG
ncbi:helix-turn-helix domain-containing protein [Actinacidiphila acidipaludis]|uniref:Pyridoxamine 5'-phosphate oxidase family protein n=1 Tax=Actinacidiphila acidipaludis TaxID=2873382 RepID=A0ABS7PZC9_9ACTN|nr:pyridoxamine 5'-phosphate oxidase family protein [Streptomyces acidipaludis]MBY8876249.1 pyridoxamine 5'-phosphate oxidase family protein [Streptomyces acidipaludis]